MSATNSIDAMLASIEHDIQSVTPDAHVIAKHLVASKKRVREKHQGHWRTVTKKVQSEAEIAFGITGVAPDLTIAGGSTLVITMQDPTWTLLDSGFFGADPESGQLDDLEVNYPDDSRRWWRLHQLSPQSDHTITLTFIPYGVSELMRKKGPVKVNRAKRTRAEFLKSLCAKVEDPSGPIEFYSKQLDMKQTISGTTDTKSSSKAPAKKAAKSSGIGANRSDLKCKGVVLTAHQAELVNTILQEGEKLNAPHNALVAAMYAAMGESTISDTVSGGVFQTTGVPSAYSGGHDTAAQAHGWFTGGTSFANSGIKLANQGVAPWQIANMVELNAAWLYHKQDSYGHQWPGGQAQGLAEAEDIVAGGGGASNGSTTIEIKQPYYFQVNAGEDYWSAMNRLAQEVGWELIVDGNRIYYDSDMTLIRQKIAAVVERDGPATLQWSYDWVNRQIATNFSLQLTCGLFEFHAGEVLQVKSFGAASLGSTADLPGRWLISEISRSAGDLFSTFTLVQPTAPKKEPAPQVVSKTIGGSGAPIGTISSETPKTARAAYAAAKWLSDRHLTYTQAVRQLVKNVPSNVPMFDCSASVSWVLLAAGFDLPSGLTWGNWAPVSGEYIPGQAGLLAGPGKEMTIYANGGHVFIRIHPQGLKDMQGNTVNPFGHGFGFFSWTASGCGSDGGPTPSGFVTTHYPGT